MKNLFLLILCCSFFALASCGDSASTSGGDKAATTASSGKSTTIGGIEVPSFSDSKLTDYATKYAKYIEKYESAYKAMKSGDASALTNLSSEGQELATAAQNLSSGIGQADAAKFSAFMEKISKRMQEIAAQ